MRGNALGRGFIVEAEHRVTGTTGLEGPNLLQVFAFEKQFRADQLVQVAGRQHRRIVYVRGNTLACIEHVRECG